MKFSNFFGKKEWSELKKFQNLDDDKKIITFYAENMASINHFRELITELTETRNLSICYVTSVKNDPILTTNNDNIKSFYIGDGTARTQFFLTLSTKILLLDMPDLENFHIKRSKKYPVHYIYIFHSMFSVHSYLRKGAIDNFDTIFCVGPHHISEIRETEKIYNLKPKKLVEYGFGRLDTLLKIKITINNPELVLIAPSYGEKNLLETCGIELIDLLLKSKHKVLLRPHFEILKKSKKLINSILEKFQDNPNFYFETGIISDKQFHNSLCMISDWSGISFEYALALNRPVIFIDVPKKILNSSFGDISIDPIELTFRKKIGDIVSPQEIQKIPSIINERKNIDLQQKMQQNSSELVFNIGNSAKIGADYILNFLNKN
tara:strand:- start:645 stop:1778 length:1134 start_codon:yes stop_codon:yes gene_type:complete